MKKEYWNYFKHCCFFIILHWVLLLSLLKIRVESYNFQPGYLFVNRSYFVTLRVVTCTCVLQMFSAILISIFEKKYSLLGLVLSATASNKMSKGLLP